MVGRNMKRGTTKAKSKSKPETKTTATTTTTTTSSPARGKKDTQLSNQQEIRIRMYRVGFGDCFMLSIPSDGGTENGSQSRHILIDCGVHSRGNIGTMEKVIDNIAQVTDRNLDVVIATHAHADHIWAFGKFGEVFSKFKVGQVWLPWTWDEKNEAAVKLQRKRAAFVNKLNQHFEALGANADPAALNAVMNLAGNEHAIELLKSGFGNSNAKVRYLKAGVTLDSEDISIPGLSVRVLGPPESTDLLAQEDPPKGKGYLRVTPSGELEYVFSSIEPFEDRWKASPASTGLHLQQKEEELLRGISSSSINDVAFALDNARNNESLVTLFVFHNKYLLFTGDAQYGNWRGWIDDEKSSSDILAKINFFKIGHHGSHNATPKAALEKMADGEFAAMVSGQSNIWPTIPHPPLMTRLNEKTKKRIVRSDWLPIEGAPKPLPHSVPEMPSELPEGFKKGDLWFDYIIPV
jgi:beta-lactamase superfamily II metal-dependent hydrolase